MNLEEAKEKYIQTWGILAAQWGVNRTMAQIHALLLASTESMSTEQVMERLQISRGNANMNLRALIDWGIVDKEIKRGERKEYFFAEKDVWEIFKQIAKERRKREIDPVIKVLDELSGIEDSSQEGEAFKKTMKDLNRVTTQLNKLIDQSIRADEHWFLGRITEVFKK